MVESLNERWNKFFKELHNCKNTPSVDAVHDLRVSIRRLDAAIDVLTNFIEDKDISLAKEELRGILKPFGQLRDIHVQQEWIENIFKKFGHGLKKYTAKLKNKERKLEQSLIRVAENFNPVFTEKMINETVPKLMEAEQRDKNFFPLRAYEIMAASFGNVKKAEQSALLDENDTEALHQLRIAFKHYRYTAELLKSLFADGKKELLKNMHSLQTLLGEIHDFDVLSDKFYKFMHKRKRTLLEIEDLKRSIHLLSQIRESYYKQFLDFPELQKNIFHPDNLMDLSKLAEVEQLSL
ncbi:MAG TPA: CHAD domain-containing protein [Thermodesulfovibrionia bacterium]|nr:CHAD domain-containing protein [Thermodesulfovibrionia bacterium]